MEFVAADRWTGKYSSWLFVIFKPLSCCFEETIEFDVKASILSRPVSHLIRWYKKPGDIIKEFWEKAILFHGSFHGWNFWGSIKLKEIFSCCDLEIPLGLIGLGVKELKPYSKRLGSCTFWTCLRQGKGRETVLWFRICEAPLNDWGNGGSVSVVFFTYGKYGFSLKDSWSYSK